MSDYPSAPAGWQQLPPNPSTAFARAITDELVRNGVSDVVLAPGSRSAALAFAAAEHDGVRLHIHIDERSAAFVALGFARASRRPAAVVTTSGTAVANLLPAVVEADQASVPLLLVTADRPVELRETGANQTIRQANMFAQHARWSVDIPAPEDRGDAVALWRSTASRAVAEAAGVAGRPGPVHLNLGFREPTVPLTDDGRSPIAVWSHPIDGRESGAPWTAGVRAPARFDEAMVERIAGQLRAVEYGMIVIGATSAPPQPMLDLGAVLGWPVIVEGTGSARVSGAGDRIASGTALFSHAGMCAAAPPDLVVRFGTTTAAPVLSTRFAGRPQMVIEETGTWSDEARHAAQFVVADSTALCAALTASLESSRVASPWRAWWNDADALVQRTIDEVLDSHALLTEPHVARDVGAVLPDGATVVVAASMPIRDVDRFVAARDGLGLIANRGASGIDGTVSTTFGVALATPAEVPTVALLGDLALLHDSNGFLLTPECAVTPMVFVVVDNDGGGIFSFLPQAAFPEVFSQAFATPHGRDLAHLAQLHGLAYHAPTSRAAFREVLASAVASPAVSLIHVRTDRADNVAFHRQLRAAITAQLDRFVAETQPPAGR